jgi:2,3-dihydroxy-p-cumate/2,3-dihydroxybenzoate 3,4-dioxygenase
MHRRADTRIRSGGAVVVGIQSGEKMLHRYVRLASVALNVSDVERSAHFYETLWGLQANGQGPDGARFFRCGPDHHSVSLHRGNPGLKRISWQLESEQDLQRLAVALQKNSLLVREVPANECKALHQGPTLRFSDPFTGVTHEYFAQMERAEEGWQPTVAKIQRVGHMVLRTLRYEEAVQFYIETLNFRISDTIGNSTTFMRCFPNKLHHSLGLRNDTKQGLHHVNFMVSEIDDIGKALWRFQKNDVPIVRGPGRHPPSGSVFLYMLDPDGITVEYSYGMEEFPEEGPRVHRELPLVPESIDTWGSVTDKRLGAVGAVEVQSTAA